MRRLLGGDAGISVLLHGLKALVALFVNWLVLRHFAVTDFVTWSVTSSVLVVATASDLGIGQYVVTQLINADRRDWTDRVGEGLGAIVPLAVLAGAFVLVAIEPVTPAYRIGMAALLAGRIVTIPFAAVLNAANQFKVRKAIELAVYVLAAMGIGAVAWSRADIRWALLILNATFLLGALLTVAATRRYVSLSKTWRAASPARSLQVFRAAVPFMANNLSGLLTYGGFIWLSSLVLSRDDVAKLAVLHSFVLMNLYQVYDVLLKARQADLADAAKLAPYRRINLAVMLVLPVAFLLLGREALALIGNPVAIGGTVTVLFGAFMALELGNLFVQSVAQVNLATVARLNGYAAVRMGALAAFPIAGSIPQVGENRIVLLLSLISVGSVATFTYLWRAVGRGRSTGSSARLSRSDGAMMPEQIS